MSLINRIKTRRLDDIINQGYRADVIGTIAGTVTDQIIQNAAAQRVFAITAFSLSTNTATPFLVTLGFSKGGTTTPFWKGYVVSVGNIEKVFAIGDERYGDENASLVVTTTGGPLVYTVHTRIISELVPLGYTQYPGTTVHKSPIFPPVSGKDRGML